MSEENKCPICRNDLNRVCVQCQTNDITDTKACPVVHGKCGHNFHKHCVDDWLRRSNKCPGNDCGKDWETV